MMSSITDREPGQGGLTVSTTMEYCKPALSRVEVMSNEGPQREGREHCCVQTVGLAVLHMQCTCSQHCYRLSYRAEWRAVTGSVVAVESLSGGSHNIWW